MGVVSAPELVTLDRFRACFKHERPRVIDVGANVGDYTAEVLARFPQAVVWAYEPQSAAFFALTERFRDVGGVVTEHIGLSSEPGWAELHASSHGACVLATLYERPDADSYHGSGVVLERTEKVRLETLDNLLAPQRVDWLKIDVEGHELDVLRGAEQIVAATDVVQFEYNDCARIAGYTLVDLHAFLWDRGFTVYLEEGEQLVLVDDPARFASVKGDFLAISDFCGWWR
jgi:FkbM family methyltransferase